MRIAAYEVLVPAGLARAVAEGEHFVFRLH
jgi:hypothetical protein